MNSENRSALAAPETPSQLMKPLLELIRARADLAEEIAATETRLTGLKARQVEIEERLLPDTMAELEMTKVTAGGYSIELKPYVNVSLDPALKPQGVQWLVDNGHGGLIKAEVSATFAKGDPAARELADRLRGDGYTVDLAESVNHQTLGKWGREMLAAGELLPDYFRVYQGRKAVIKPVT